jgi:hypothetical protein
MAKAAKYFFAGMLQSRAALRASPGKSAKLQGLESDEECGQRKGVLWLVVDWEASLIYIDKGKVYILAIPSARAGIMQRPN